MIKDIKSFVRPQYLLSIGLAKRPGFQFFISKNKIYHEINTARYERLIMQFPPLFTFDLKEMMLEEEFVE